MLPFEENETQSQYADYSCYLQLIKLNYTKEQVAKHMSIKIEELEKLILKFD